jgi:glycosyltransferase involved in cell wall biosynthesis
LPGDIVPALMALPSQTVVVIHHLLPPPGNTFASRPSALANWTVQAFCLQLVKAFVRAIVFVSPHVMAECARMADGKRTFLSTNGVGAIPAPAGDPPERTGAVYLGRLHPAKRVGDALQAWARLPSSLGSPILRIVGGGEEGYTEHLKGDAKRLGIADRVVFYGSVSEERKWELLRESQFFVFPSGEEGWGIAVAEAMAAGLPCVTYDLPVYRELFTGGRIEVPLGDVDALASACAALLDDAPQRERLAREAQALGAEFTWDKAARAELDALRSVLTRDTV